jgi:hypothetical protein
LSEKSETVTEFVDEDKMITKGICLTFFRINIRKTNCIWIDDRENISKLSEQSYYKFSNVDKFDSFNYKL